jgi:hypothetical protein
VTFRQACVTPARPELEVDNKELEAEGMMFVGDKGKILTGVTFRQACVTPARPSC